MKFVNLLFQFLTLISLVAVQSASHLSSANKEKLMDSFSNCLVESDKFTKEQKDDIIAINKTLESSTREHWKGQMIKY
jgi:hypothetical protein